MNENINEIPIPPPTPSESPISSYLPLTERLEEQFESSRVTFKDPDRPILGGYRTLYIDNKPTGLIRKYNAPMKLDRSGDIGRAFWDYMEQSYKSFALADPLLKNSIGTIAPAEEGGIPTLIFKSTLDFIKVESAYMIAHPEVYKALGVQDKEMVDLSLSLASPVQKKSFFQRLFDFSEKIEPRLSAKQLVDGVTHKQVEAELTAVPTVEEKQEVVEQHSQKAGIPNAIYGRTLPPTLITALEDGNILYLNDLKDPDTGVAFSSYVSYDKEKDKLNFSQINPNQKKQSAIVQEAVKANISLDNNIDKSAPTQSKGRRL